MRSINFCCGFILKLKKGKYDEGVMVNYSMSNILFGMLCRHYSMISIKNVDEV